jgi:thiosulfate dehydrogenase
MNNKLLRYGLFFLLLPVLIVAGIYKLCYLHKKNLPAETPAARSLWKAPDIKQLPATADAAMIKYGRDLIVNTAGYLGPKGTIAKISNGMNCQNCHLDAGTRTYGNSFAFVASAYPKYRDRSGRVESIPFRINECMERSMNGKALDSNSREMKAMTAYLQWIGTNPPEQLLSAGINKLQVPFIERSADPVKGKFIFISKWITCHGANGAGKLNTDSSGFIYPPLWGEQSYNVSAGMYRLTRLATFIKYNMPFTTLEKGPQLTDE